MSPGGSELASDPTEAALFAALAALNLLLAALVVSTRPARAANVAVALLFAGNGAATVAIAATVSGVDLNVAVLVLDSLTYGALLAVPFLFPRRRLGRLGERVLLAVCVAVSLGRAAVVAFVPASRPPDGPLDPLTGVVPVALILALGTVLLLDAYLDARTRIVREQAAWFLAAYALAIGTRLLQPTDQGAANLGGQIVLLLAWATAAAVAVALLVSRARGRARERPAALDAAVLSAFAAGAAFSVLSALTALGVLSYLLVRPVVLAFGILRYQVLEIDAPRRALAVAIVGLAATSVVLAAAAVLEDLRAPLGLLVSLPILLGLAAAYLLAGPGARLVAPPPGAGAEARDREVYRAALEEAVASRRDDDTSRDRVLRALRERLGIGEREHALLEASVRASLGGEAGLADGRRFLGRYRVERQLGEGGFARAFLAVDEQVGRRVVLKTARVAGADEARRALREARVLARVGHPRIVTLHDVELVGQECVLVLEHVEGGSLADRLAAGPLPVPQALAIADDVLAALEAAHAEGILHRDVKPSNVLLGKDGRAKLADFGIAREIDGSGTATGLSLDGRGAGSPRYMSPEQVRGLPLDARSDLYSLAVVLYEAIAGRSYLDFTGRAAFDVRLAILEEEALLPLPEAPEAVNAVLASALAKDPAARPASAAQMRRLLAAAAPPRPG